MSFAMLGPGDKEVNKNISLFSRVLPLNKKVKEQLLSHKIITVTEAVSKRDPKETLKTGKHLEL